jgi:hypothetical protein
MLRHDVLAIAMPGAQMKRLYVAVRIVTAALVEAFGSGRAISYSRNKSYYSTHYRHTPYTYHHVVGAIDVLVAAGLLATEIAPANPRLHRQSTFRATPMLIQWAESLGDEGQLVALPRPALVRLMNYEGGEVSFAETARTKAMARDVARLNEIIGATDIDLGIGTKGWGGIIRIERANGKTACMYPSDQSFRKFRGSFERGGRLYGGGWQQVPKDCRKSLTINGNATEEHDYEALHPCMLYALEGKQVDPQTVYELPGCEDLSRGLQKRAVNTLINARSTTAARRSLMDNRKGKGVPSADAQRLIEGTFKRHPDITSRFGRDMGAKLQAIDSEIARDVCNELTGKGKPVLPVHDSFLVRKADSDQLRGAMNDAYERRFRTRANIKLTA